VLSTTTADERTLTEALNELCREVIDRERKNTSSAVQLFSVPKPEPDREYMVPFLPPLPRHNISIWFGDGGTGKSLLALYVAGQLAQKGVPTLYCDWELDRDEHRLRYEQLFGTAIPQDLWYWRCDRPLVQVSDAIRREVKKHRIDFVVVDSVGYACGDSPESASVATQYTIHARSFGVGSLHLAHTTKAGDNAKLKPFGSTFWHNSARSSWYIEAVTGKTRNGVTATDLKFYHRKSNFGPLEERRDVLMTAHKDRGPIRLAAPSALRRSEAGNGSGNINGSVAERLKALLAASPLPREVARKKLDVIGDTFRQAVRRGKEDGWLSEPNGQLTLK
jgi:hypothetical protein